MSLQCNCSLSDEYILPFMRKKPNGMTAGAYGSTIIKDYLDGKLVYVPAGYAVKAKKHKGGV